MVAMKVNSFVASLDPSDANRDLDTFLYEASNALNLKSDADLARTMLVSPATFASWKRRNRLPTEQARWFQNVFPAMVFDRWRNSIPPYAARAVEYVLPSINLFYGDRLGNKECLRDAAAAFGGLIAFVPIIANTHIDPATDEVIDIPDEAMIETLTGALEWRAKRAL